MPSEATMAATQDPVKGLVFKSLKRSHDMFLSEFGKAPPLHTERCVGSRMCLSTKLFGVRTSSTLYAA